MERIFLMEKCLELSDRNILMTQFIIIHHWLAPITRIDVDSIHGYTYVPPDINELIAIVFWSDWHYVSYGFGTLCALGNLTSMKYS